MQASRACVRGLEFLGDILTFGDVPVEAEAIHRAEYVVIVIVANDDELVVAVDTE